MSVRLSKPANRRRMAGAALATLGVYMNVPFSVLASQFGYPDILRKPAAEVLARFAEGGQPLIVAWYAYALAALFFIPMTLLAARAAASVGGRPGPARASAVFGVLAGAAQALGLLRWVFVVPYLAGVVSDPAATPAAKQAAVVVFEAFHRYAGVAVGEHLGQLFTALWAGTLAVSLLSPRRPVPVWLAWAGVVIGAALAVGLIDGFATVLPFSPGALAAVTPVAYLALSAWMVALGVAFVRPVAARKTVRLAAVAAPLLLLAAVSDGPANAQTDDNAAPRRVYVHTFRSPSVGLEYRAGDTGIHAGLYTTILGRSGRSTEFVKAGATRYFGGSGADGRQEFFAGASYLRGLNRDYKGRSAFMAEGGSRWRLGGTGSGFEFRLGAGLLAGGGRPVRLNPMLGLSWGARLR